MITVSQNQVTIQMYDTLSVFPATGNEDYLYIDKATSKLYRWDGTQYVEIVA